MRLSRFSGPALLLGLVGLSACDVAMVALDPTIPGIVQTWNFPASDSEIGVSSLLPNGVGLNTDTSAFTVDVDSVDFNRRLGGYCSLCQLLNGTTSQKPAFIISPDTGGEARLPQNVRGGSVLRGKLFYSIQNTFAFDPIRTNTDLTQDQGWMTIVVRSGSLVLGRDSISGKTTALDSGTVYLDSIALSTGNITGDIIVDLTVNSPQGPSGQPKRINANGLITLKADVLGLEISSARIDVVNAQLSSGDPVELPKDVLPSAMVDRVVSGSFEMTMVNPFAVVGDMDVQFAYQAGQAYNRLLGVPTGAAPQLRSAAFDSTEMRNILRGEPDPTNPDETLPSKLSIGGVVNTPPASPITVTPRQSIQITNRLVLQVRAFGSQEN